MPTFFLLFFIAAESDLATFVQIRNHYKSKLSITSSLFTRETRTPAIQELYDAAALTPVHTMEEIDRLLGRDDRTSSEIFLCTPILGQSRKRMRRNIDVEIETRLVSNLNYSVSSNREGWVPYWIEEEVY